MVAQIDMAFLKARPRKLWPRLLAYTLFEGRPLTTRGRWINPIVFALFRLWVKLPAFTHDERPIYILGVGRSGTTILGTILALHRDVGYLNEPKALWHAALGDDDLIGSYSKTPGRFRMSHADATAQKIQRLRRFYGAFLATSGSRRIVDKYPELLFRPGLIKATFPRAKKIVLIRNGLDICRSIERWSKIHGQPRDQGVDDWWGRNRRKWHILVDELVANDPDLVAILPAIKQLTHHADMAAVEWIVTMRAALKIQAEVSENVLFVKYEDLVEFPDNTLKTILGFCGLEPDETMLSYARNTLRPVASGNPYQPSPEILKIFNETMGALGYLPRLAA
ncbi:MAG: sulfotransferase [Paracoccaceae bacterium]